jgi:hypothetical protein
LISLTHLTRRSEPLYGQVVLAALLIGALAYAAYFLGQASALAPEGQAGGPATFLWVLPARWLADAGWVFAASMAAMVVYVLGSITWITRKLVPFSSWATTAAFLAITALHLQFSQQATHVAHLPAMLMVVYALWYQLCAADIRKANREGRFLETPLYPRWVHGLSVYSVGVFYGWSGISKLLQSGIDWPNGVSLQLWASLWGNSHSFLTGLILANRRLATFLQWIVLIGELGAIPAIFFSKIRCWIGLVLIGFHLGQIAVFGWGFHANLILIALIFLPVDRWVARWRSRRGSALSNAAGIGKMQG